MSETMTLDYPAAARVVWLYLEEFHDTELAAPDSVADIARKASARIDFLRALVAQLTTERDEARAQLARLSDRGPINPDDTRRIQG